MRDLKSRIDVVNSIAPAAVTATATGAGVDLQGYDSACVAIVAGTRTDGVHTPKMQESDDDSTYTDVAAGDMHGTFAAIATGVSQRVGYKGVKRYIRCLSTVSAATTGAVYAAVVIRGNANLRPVE